MESIAIFGGTFNPVHNGHINLAVQIKNQLSIDRLVFMPAHIPPHKLNAEELARDEDRYEMCKLAIDGLDGFEVSDYEIKNESVSYTVYTLRHYKEAHPNAKLYFIMGSDMFLSLKTWYCFEEILSLSTIITASRLEGEFEKISSFAKTLEEYHADIVILAMKPYEISSSQIRNNVKGGKDFTCYLPKRVVQYIRNKKMYGV